METQAKKKKDPVRDVISSGKLFDTKQSVFKYEAGSTRIILFGGEEVRKNYPGKALYNTNGKNPFDGAAGKTLGLKLYSFGPDFTPLNLAGPANDYAPLSALTKLLNQTKFKVTLGKDEVRSFLAIEAHDPLPQILGYQKVGNGISPSNETVAGWVYPEGSIENERNIIRLPLNVEQGQTFSIIGTPEDGVTPGNTLVDYLLVGRLFVIEEKSVNK
ncbi:hypothetical protein LPTSP4_09150 [Leptospira ryugenii]|uniref:Uncharacterized protein n=1 Tax=Leptospira ryugenii TaxID=1917863 RepID=A0A2P2DXP6_9LEPT|nr:hypothetical protein [Leptospira ryugenii]GBF49402.1 hypothetical protein LPTSP4_09150 [Leptospira ryugenii]